LPVEPESISLRNVDRTAKALEHQEITVPAGVWGAVTLALLGVGIPLAFGSPALGIVLTTLAVVTAGLTLRAWATPGGAAPSEGPLSTAEIVERLSCHRDRTRELALSPDVDAWTYEECREVADANEAEVGTAIRLLCPECAHHWPSNRMMYDPSHPPPPNQGHIPGPMQAHFRDRMRYTATQLDRVIAEVNDG
jgi:hypothetical protein